MKMGNADFIARDQLLDPVSVQQRISSIDILRGVALLGILLMNIVGMGLLVIGMYLMGK